MPDAVITASRQQRVDLRPGWKRHGNGPRARAPPPSAWPGTVGHEKGFAHADRARVQTSSPHQIPLSSATSCVGCRIGLCATTSAEDILAMLKTGRRVPLSNGPGADAAGNQQICGAGYAGRRSSRARRHSDLFGRRMLGLRQSRQDQEDAPGPSRPSVRDETTGKVEITSMNHGFAASSNADQRFFSCSMARIAASRWTARPGIFRECGPDSQLYCSSASPN